MLCPRQRPLLEKLHRAGLAQPDARHIFPTCKLLRAPNLDSPSDTEMKIGKVKLGGRSSKPRRQISQEEGQISLGMIRIINNIF